MITHSDEEIEEHGSTLFHLSFHCPTLLEVIAAADDEGEVLGSKL